MQLGKALIRHLELVVLSEEWIHERKLGVVHHTDAVRHHRHVEGFVVVVDGVPISV